MLNIKFNIIQHESQWVVDHLGFTMKIHVHDSLPTDVWCFGDSGYCKNSAHSGHVISVQISWKAA